MTEKELKELHEIYLTHPKITRNSKEVKEGDIFWAIKGERFDGNKFAQEAYEGIYEGVMLTKPLAKILYFYPIVFITILFCHFIYKLFT